MSDKLYSTIRVALNEHNYHDWKFAISMLLKHRNCWKVVSGEETKPSPGDTGAGLVEWQKKADEGLTIIGLTVDPSQYAYIRDAKDGAEAWQKLKDIYEKNSRATRIALKQQFYNFKQNPQDSMQSYVTGITEVASRLKGIGITLTDEEITDVMIFNLDAEYSSIAATLMASKDALKVSDVSSALLEEERRKGGPADTGSGPGGYTMTGRSLSCFRCNRNGHRMADCKARATSDGRPITRQIEDEARERLGKFRSKESSSFARNISTLNDVAY